MSLFRRLFGADAGNRPASTVILYDSANPDTATNSDEAEHSTVDRRRRGGRGRGKNSQAAANGGPGVATPQAAGPPPRDARRWRRPALASLEAPLPEDVAFRPATEGGDASIAPPRRRPSAQRTDRVLHAGIKQYVPRVATSIEIAPPPSLTETEVLSDESAEGEEVHKRRRRGRRGGQGRRRVSEAGASADTSEATEPEEHHQQNGHAPSAVLPEDVIDPSPAPALIPVDVDPSRFPPAFRALGLDDRTLALVATLGFTEPTPIQQQAIPLLLRGRDVVGIAQTGTGKTLAFGLPMVERLDAGRRTAQGLVLVPTRELAQQVLDVLTRLGQTYGLDVVGLLGGRSLDRDFQALERHPQIVVGTPGRVIDHLHRETLSLADVRYAVLDEADQMLDIGFMPDITRILSRTPRARQTALFSATMPHSILRLVRRYMHEPETVTIAPEQTTVETVEQVYFEVAQRDKVRGLKELIERELRGRTLVFSRTRRGVDYLADQLQGAGIRVGALHGDMDQRKRDQVVQQFRGGQLDILVATNVAARGLDIPEITHVLNYDVPQNAEEYVHRIGRTGRAGREGKAITFVCERDMAEFDTLLAAFGDRLQKEHLELYT